MIREAYTISLVEYRNPTNAEVATVLFTRIDGSKTVIGTIREINEAGETAYHAVDTMGYVAYPPAPDIKSFIGMYERDIWRIRDQVSQLDRAEQRGETKAQKCLRKPKAPRSSKSQDSLTK